MKGITANNYFIPDKVHDFSASGWSLAYTVLASGYGIGLSFPSSPGSTVYFGADDNQNAMLKISWYAVDGTHLTYSDNSGAVEPESAAVGVIVVRNMSDEIDTQVSCRPWARRVL